MAQNIKGTVAERIEHKAINGVQLLNIHNGAQIFTDSNGSFSIKAAQGELIELHCPGYQTTRFRVPKGNVPPFFKIYLDEVVKLNKDKYASSGFSQYQIDSIENAELYRTTLGFPKMSAFEKIESPFSALSKSNRLKWAFQESYAYFEQEKFIDFTFNENLVKQLTGLEGEELQRYMKFYRPSYDALRKMNQYEYFNYIKVTGERYRKLRSRPQPRNSG